MHREEEEGSAAGCRFDNGRSGGGNLFRRRSKAGRAGIYEGTVCSAEEEVEIKLPFDM